MDLKELYQAVVNGNAPVVKEGVQAALDEGVEPGTLMFECLVPAMQEVGEEENMKVEHRLSYMALIGIETSGYIRNRWSYRWYAELAGTSCDYIKSDIWNCAYNHGIYETGYRYQGRAIGHGTDNDTEIVSSGFVLVSNDDSHWHVLLRNGDINREGPLDIRNSLTPSPLELSSIDVTHSRPVGKLGWLDIGVGYEQVEDTLTGEDTSDARGFITWRSR